MEKITINAELLFELSSKQDWVNRVPRILPAKIRSGETWIWVDKNGNVLYERKPKVVQALNEQTAYVMTYMLKGVVEEGTGVRMRYKYGLNNPIGGKTGTTNDNSDGWFMGITPQLVGGVWTGCEDRAFHFTSTRDGEGANSALPIFAGFMKRVYANPKLKISRADFEPPKDGIQTEIDCERYTNPTLQEQTELDKKLGF